MTIRISTYVGDDPDDVDVERGLLGSKTAFPGRGGITVFTS